MKNSKVKPKLVKVVPNKETTNKKEEIPKTIINMKESDKDSPEKIKTNKIVKETLNIPWIEKYRPKKVEDLVLENDTLNKIKKIIEDKDMPNIIINGVPGIGKTTTILCIAKNLFGKYFEDGVLELNASDDRGIKAVQDSIFFCKKKLHMPDDPVTGKTYPKHKIILLDEADNMTVKAQQLIGNLMSEYHKTTRFAFTCNTSTSIIEAIQSRCIIFRYLRLTDKQLSFRLKKICEIENITYTEDGVQSLVTTAQGDMRKAINNLQLTYNGYTTVTTENVYKLCDKPYPLIIQNIFIACNNKDLKQALTYLNTLRDNGYSSSDISMSMKETLTLTEIPELPEATKIKFMIEVSNSCLIISKGVDKPLQLTGCIAKLCLI